MSRLCQYCPEPSKTLGMCAKHYQYIWAWLRRGPKALLEHKEKLAVRSVILENGTPRAMPSNVVHLNRHPNFKRKQVATKRGRKLRRAG